MDVVNIAHIRTIKFYYSAIEYKYKIFYVVGIIHF